MRIKCVDDGKCTYYEMAFILETEAATWPTSILDCTKLTYNNELIDYFKQCTKNKVFRKRILQ